MASRKMPPPPDHDPVPEWTDEEIARARPGAEVLPPKLVAALKRARGRPVGATKEQVSIRLDKDILDRFRATGPGWQSRINEALRKAVA